MLCKFLSYLPNFLNADIVFDILKSDVNMTVVKSACLDQFGDSPVLFIAVYSFVISTE